MKPFIATIVVLAFCPLLLQRDLLGQSTSASVATGFPENGAFEGSSFDSIQMNNGNLHIQIPFLTLPGRNRSYHYLYSYDNRGWGFKTFNQGNGVTVQSVIPETFNGMSFRLPDPLGGFDVSRIVTDNVQCGQDTTNSPPIIFYGSIYNYVVVEKNGTKHGFAPILSTPVGPSCGQKQITPYRAYATDGSGWVIDIGSDGNVTRAINKEGTQQSIDKNGNTLTAEIPSKPQYWVVNPNTGHNEFRYYDSDGNLQAISVPTVPVPIQTQLCQFADHCSSSGEYTATWNQPQIIKFPNNLSYQFTYEQRFYGEPNSVVLPTGARIQWTWGNLDQGGRKVTSRTVITGGHTYIWNYTWGAPVFGGTWQNSVIDPLGNKTVYTCQDLSGIFAQDPYPACAITKTEFYELRNGNLNLIKTIATDYCPNQSGTCAVTGVLVPIRETTTWNENNLVSKVEMDWDAFNPGGGATTTRKDLIEKREFDYGVGGPGVLLRRTHFDYLHLNPSATYQPYRDANLVDLLASQIIYDGANNTVSQETHNYDEYTVSPMISTATSPASGHDYQNFSASNIVRGNITTTSRWRNTDGAWLSMHNTYDDLGNLRSTQDILGHTTTFSYVDGWGNTLCVPAGFSSQSLITQITNALGQNVQHSYYSCTGMAQSVKDQNDISNGRAGTLYRYDLVNRRLSVTYPDGGLSAAAYSDIPPSLSAVDTDQITSALPRISTSIKDDLGRVIQSQLNSDPDGVDYADTTYDPLGRVTTVSNPHRTASAPTDGITSTTYDALGRVIQVTKQDGSISKVQYDVPTTIALNANCAISTDEAGNPRGACTDALGRLVEVDEPNPGATFNVNNHATMQQDGNFVLYNSANNSLWASNTSGSNASSIMMQDDGNLVLYIFKWSAGTYAVPTPGSYPPQGCSIGSYLVSGQRISSNQCIVSPHGQYMLYMAPDGNFYIYDMAHGVATWSANTYSHPGAYAVLQSDGNFVVYATNGVALWNSGTSGTYSERLDLEDDGRIILYKSAWNSGTSTGQFNWTQLAHPGCDAGTGTGWTGVLGSGQCFVSPNGHFELLMQGDGNLVINDLGSNPPRLLWASNTAVSPVDPGFAMRTLYAYDTLGNLLRVEQHGGTTDSSQWRVRTFTYNSLSQLLTATNPESGTLIYTYNNDGNVATKTDARNIVATFAYDALHRITSKTYSDGTLGGAYTYDQTGVWGVNETNTVGRLVLAYNGQNAATLFSYDAMGRVLTEWDCPPSAFGVGCPTVQASYDLAGDLSQLIYPNGEIVNFTVNGAGHTTAVADNSGSPGFVSNAVYSPAGQIAGFVSGSGSANITNLFSYNQRLQPCRITASAGALPANCGDTTNHGNMLDVAYDFHVSNGNNGNVYGITNYKDTSRNQAFTYDVLNRLLSAQNAGTNCAAMTVNGKTEYWGNSYTYDAWGNLTNKTVTKCGAENLSAPALTNNRLSGYSYDATGNMTNDGQGHAFTYDGEGRITSLNSGSVQYTYDPEMGRVRKDISGQASTEYFYFGSQIMAEKNISTGAWTNYIFFNGERVARREYPAGNAFYYFSDHLKTASVITDASGTITAESDYYPWGGELQFLANDSNHYKFTGKERDSETGLDYFGARYYGNTFGRFITPDWSAKAQGVPYADYTDPQSLNLYGYVRNNPLSKVDADGHDSMAISFDDYKAHGPLGIPMPFTGHGALVTIDSKGHTHGYEYGRYDKGQKGIVRNLKTSNVVMKNGKPTDASMKKLLGGIAKQEHDYKGTISGAYYKMSDQNTAKVDAYAQGREAQNSDPNRTPYNLGISGEANNCGTFSRDAIHAGGADTSAANGDTRPESIVSDMQKGADIKITYDASKDQLTEKEKKPQQ
jgi:RHS repeat-associated protein